MVSHYIDEKKEVMIYKSVRLTISTGASRPCTMKVCYCACRCAYPPIATSIIIENDEIKSGTTMSLIVAIDSSRSLIVWKARTMVVLVMGSRFRVCYLLARRENNELLFVESSIRA